METRIYHGKISPADLARALVTTFNRGNLMVQQIGDGSNLAVQIASRGKAASGGQTALSVTLQEVADGVSVQVGQQAWVGVAASLGFSALAALLNPWNLMGRLDDIAQDIESLQLSEEVWKVLDSTARSLGSGYELSDRLKRIVCEYCQVANPVGEPTCLACGAPLGNVQPVTCKYCGYTISSSEKFCPNCGKPVYNVSGRAPGATVPP
ncbi:MAG TPA: zinc-ribbon domain-containing protein [Anaerolineaceae bacterium]|nr:zinc-ribbon domain-containing protein [Anaerolineaceae bacterium]